MSNTHDNDSLPEESGTASVFDDIGVESYQGRRNHKNSNNSRRNDAYSPPRHHSNSYNHYSHIHTSNSRHNRRQGSTSPRGRNTRSPRRHANSPKRNHPADMSVIVKRIDLWDSIRFGNFDESDDVPCVDQGYIERYPPILPYHFAPDISCWTGTSATDAKDCTVTQVRAPYHPQKPGKHTDIAIHESSSDTSETTEHSDATTHDPSVCHYKYWAQRRRLFSKFDLGIQLDAEGWFSVTPEVIADHVAKRVGSLVSSAAFRQPGNATFESQGIIVLDAFCGCGGNSISFGKLPHEQVSMVVCVDLDRTKLQKAAHNASLYDIPKEKLIFVECNTLFVMEHCYKNGVLQINDLLANGVALPDPVQTEVYSGFFIGGLGMLPPRIDAIFMDPPWGGVDYNALGKEGYTLESHMKITKIGIKTNKPPLVQDDFFDSFGTAGSIAPADSGDCLNGAELLQMAALATKSRLVIYDLPRNTNKYSLGQSALMAGYRGNIKLEEHYLNGRLKTITAYAGADYSHILEGSEEPLA